MLSTIEHTASASIGKIPIGRRISELLEERGDAFSIRAFAARIGINRETFRTILKGERPITLPELEKVVEGLRITEERLRQLDTFKKQEELENLLKASKRTKVMMLRAQTMANELAGVAMGMTERCISLANLGRAQFHLQQYDEAHELWLEATKLAEKVNEEFGDSTLLYHVSSFLLISFTIRKEYTNILHTLNTVESYFGDDPEKMGYVHYTRMKWHEHRGNLEKAKDHSYIALKSFEQTSNKSQIGKAQINVAHFEYLTGHYDKAKEVLASAMENLRSFDYFYLLAVKDYVKVLLQLDDHSTASQIITANIEHAKDYPDFKGKLQIMYTLAEDDPAYAESIIEDLRMSVSIRYMACKSLMDYYSSKGDAESLIRYYEKGRILSKKKNQFFDAEGF